jgi:hypothetical protein
MDPLRADSQSMGRESVGRESMEPQAAALAPQAGQEQVGQDTASIQTASAEPTDLPAANLATSPAAAPSVPPQKPASVLPAMKAASAPAHVNNRPGYMLNDAQIASIKGRLHLTPGQEEMWPAVEAALRNMAYTHVPQHRGHGATAGDTQTAAVDPQAVQGLKSAAVPLIMSFNTEQKDEVRNIVHVMGLDQLASQF